MTHPPPTHSTPGATREAFLARVREAVRRGRPEPPFTPAPAPDQSLARLVHPADDLPALFRARATAAGSRILDAAMDWPALLTRELASRNVRRATLAIADPVLRDAAARALAAANIELLAGDGVQHQFHADAGITDVHAALAETGSIVLASSPHAPRGAALIPPVHLALVRRAQILPDLLDLFTPGLNPPAALTIISSPSKTADIEGILITGVHGPRELVILLI